MSDVSAASEAATVSLDLEEGYRFHVDLGQGFAPLVMDEPAPLGGGSGPNASRLLGAAVGNCLSASLLYCLRRARIEVEGLRTDVTVSPRRNEEGRLRIGSIRVELHPRVAPGAEGRMSRCLELFESFCVVTGGVREGIEVDVAVDPDSRDTAGEPTAPAAE
jgi:organic hydroperoxide reductase OsmC/OhrA